MKDLGKISFKKKERKRVNKLLRHEMNHINYKHLSSLDFLNDF